ncbi:hypothetical protein [Rhodococcus koreensis]|uniref:hypothetical protein n=1 Tax=Rhodococcus koreensis TaxID=99653 RepID=UPI00366F0A2B
MRTLSRRACALVVPDGGSSTTPGWPRTATGLRAVALQYSGALRTVGNCQIAVSLHAPSDAGCRPFGLTAVPARELGRSVQHRRRTGRGDHRPQEAVRDPRRRA